ncbi:MAG: iron chelate uptake ABC transporter family permease subunit, partial [Pseudomonadota bacterium]
MAEDIIRNRKRGPLHSGLGLWGLLAVLAFLLALLFIASAGLGYIEIPFMDVARIILSRITGYAGIIGDMDRLFPVVVMDVRLPRILTSAIVGAGLAISGVVFQGILLNPLADPYTLGVSAGAAFGASLAILLNISVMG